MSILTNVIRSFYILSMLSLLQATTFMTNAAEPIYLQYTQFQNLQKQFDLSLSNKKQLDNPSTTATSTKSGSQVQNRTKKPNRLQLISQQTDSHHITHIRLQQEYLGFLVFGGYAILHTSDSQQSLKENNANIKMNGTIYQGLEQELGQPPAEFMANTNVAIEKFKALFPNKELSEPKVTPIVYLDNKHRGHWAYKVSLFMQNYDSIPQRPTAILDAKTFKPFIQWDNIKTARKLVKGRGYGGNEKMGKFTYGDQLPYLNITREVKTKKCYFENDSVLVVDMKHKSEYDNLPIRFSCMQKKFAPKDSDSANLANLVFWTGYNNDGYDKTNGAYSPANDALYTGEIIKNLYKDWYHQNVLSNNDGSAMKLVMRVHYRSGYENAFWDGDNMTMTFGDGYSIFYPLTSIGVTSHEVSHGFTQQHSNLLYYGQSGGIDESFSDMAAQTAEYYVLGKSSWQIGSEILKPDSGYDSLRFLDQPSRDGSSIDSADEFYPELDVHFASGVFNRLFYLIAHQRGWNVRKAFNVMVKANMDYWTPYTDFQEAGCGVLSAAKNLGYKVKNIQQSLKKVGIDYNNC